MRPGGALPLSMITTFTSGSPWPSMKPETGVRVRKLLVQGKLQACNGRLGSVVEL
jgi:hypothetical protein